MKTIALQNITQSYDYDNYRSLVMKYAQEFKTSGDQSEERIAATLINAQRIKRIDKQCIINPELHSVVAETKKKQRWVVITESWCGDGAQCIPVIAKVAQLNENIKLEFVFRDEHPHLIDCFLTNGSRSIPKLVCIDEDTEAVSFVWGPRPQVIQDKVSELKKDNPSIPHDELVKNIHLWYAQDKTNAIQSELAEVLNRLNSGA